MNSRLHQARGLMSLLVLLACFVFAGTTAKADTLFYDGFEGGLGNWSYSGASLRSYVSYWGVWSMETDNNDWAVRAQSTVGYSGIQLSFYHQTNGFEWWDGDDVFVDYSPNGGSNWYNLGSWNSNFSWSHRSYNLPSSCNDNPNFRIRFRSSTNSNGDETFWDEVYITGSKIERTLTVNTTGSGSVSQSPSPPYYHNDVVQLTANPSSGWTFSHWSGNLSGSTNPQNITMNSNKTVTANFVDNTPPANPTGLAATAGDGQVSLDWADNGESDLSYYKVYRSTTSGSGYGLIKDNQSTSAYTDTSAANGTTYYYVVTAVDLRSNESGYSNEASATPVDSTPPAAPSGLAATSGDSQVSLNWNDNGEGDLASYSVYRSTTSGSGYASIATGVATSDYVDNTAVNGTTYYYVVTALDNNSNESGYSNEASATPADTTPPAAPTSLNATAGDAEVSLNWADNTEPDLASYSVYRSTTTGGPYSSIATGLVTSDYLDNTTTNGTTFYYVVTAVDNATNESAYSAEDSATPQPTQYTLTTSVTGSGHIDNTNPGPYYYGDETVLRAIPDSGHEFVNWTGDITTDTDTLDLTITQNLSLTANFQQETPPGPVLGTRVLIVGDSWAEIMWNEQSLRDVFVAAGFSGIYEDGDTTALGGTTADWWAQPANLQLITDELNANANLDMVHLSMGGNDFLAGQANGGWYKGMGASAEAALFDAIKADIKTVIDHILSIRPDIHIVICSYDYINLWDTLNITGNQLTWDNLGQPTPRELNNALIEMGNHQHELALDYGASVTYVNNWGAMHYAYGYNAVFPPERFPQPWGHPNYPWPKEAGANNGDDAIHLDAEGYEWIALNCWVKFYQYLIDPNAGPLPPDADSFPEPPPATYSQIFYDGFEDANYTTNNWFSLSGVTWETGTYWGTWCLGHDNTDESVLAKSTAGYENIRVRVNLKTSGLDAFPQDYFRLYYTTDYGASWVLLEEWTSSFDWSFREYLLPVAAENNANFGIKFKSNADSGSDDSYIDEVYIEGNPLPCTLRTLTRKVEGQGSISTSPGPDWGSSDFCDGSVVQLTAAPADGWTFVEWSGAVSGTSNPVNVTMNAAKTVTAKFVDSAGKPGLSTDQFDWMKWVSWGIDVDALSATWPAATTAQASSLLYKANEAQTTFETYHMPYGQAANMWYSDYTRSTVDKYETIGDSTYFLGIYLGGLANQYAVDPTTTTLAKIDSVLDTFDMLSQCSGKSGYIVRFAGDTNDPAYQAYYQGYGNGYATCVSPWQNYTWLDYSSRDTYVGAGFGLGNVWIHVNDSAIRTKCQTIAERIIDRLIADDWNIVSPTGKFTNFTPGFMTLWQRLGITMNDAKYGSQYNYGSSFWLWEDTGGMDIDGLHSTDYFANLLTTNILYVVRRLETNQDKINVLTNKLLYAAEGKGGRALNAHYAAAYLGGTGHLARNVPKGVLQGTLIDYESGEHWMEDIDQSANPDYPHYDSEHSIYALMVRDRPHNEYLWAPDPSILADGADIPWAYMMLDKYTVYWMGRESGAIPAP